MHDNEVLRAEFDIVAHEHSKSIKQGEWDELKNTINSLRALNSTLKSDVVRKREKNKSAKEEIQKLKAEVKKLRDVQEKSLLVPLDEMREMPPVQPEEYNRMRQEYEGLRREIRRLGAQDKQDKVEYIQVILICLELPYLFHISERNRAPTRSKVLGTRDASSNKRGSGE